MWHADPKVAEDLERFAKLFARYPQEEEAEVARQVNRYAAVMKEKLEKRFKPAGGIMFQKVGSVAEHTRVKVPVEVDVLFAITYQGDDLSITEYDDSPACQITRSRAEDPTAPAMIISPEKISKGFFDTMLEIKEEISKGPEKIHVYKRGLTSIIFSVKAGKKILFDIDVIPAIQLSYEDGPSKEFVPKSTKKISGWLPTHVLKERKIFKLLPLNDPRLKCLRILKAIRDHDEDLNRLWSAIFKNILLKHRSRDWEEVCLTEHVLRCLQAAASACQTGRLGKFLNPEDNLMTNYTEAQREKIGARLGELYRKEAVFVRFLYTVMMKEKLA